MEFYNNLDPSLFPQYDTFMQSHDLPGEYQASQMIQNPDTFQLPPGAEATDSPSFTLRRQAGYLSQALPPQGYTQTEEHAGRMLTTSSVNSQSDGSESSLYAPSPSDSNSPSPSPSPSHVFNLRALIPRIGPVSFSHRIPDNATRDIPQNHHPPSFHSRNSSYPPYMPPPANAVPYLGVPQPPFTFSMPLSMLEVPTLPASLDTNFPLIFPTPHDVLDAASSDFARPSSEADILHVPDVQNTILSPYAHSSFSAVPSSSQTGPADMMVGPSSQTPTILLTGVGTDDPTLTFSSSGSQKEEQEEQEPNSTNPSSSLRVVSSVVSYDAPHQKVDRRPPLREQRKPRKGKRKAPPKDQKATKRLRDQRKKEDEAIQALYGLFVPDDVGVKQKKDWLSTILYYASGFVAREKEKNGSARVETPSGSTHVIDHPASG